MPPPYFAVTNSFLQHLLFVKLHSSLILHFYLFFFLIQKQTQPSVWQKDDFKHSWRLSNSLPLSNSGSGKDVQGKNFCQQILATCSDFPYRKNLFDLAKSHLWTSAGSICIISRITSDRSCHQKLLWNLVNWVNMVLPGSVRSRGKLLRSMNTEDNQKGYSENSWTSIPSILWLQLENARTHWLWRLWEASTYYWSLLNTYSKFKILAGKKQVSKLAFKRKIRKSLTLRNTAFRNNSPLKQLQISSWVTYENVIYVKEHFSNAWNAWFLTL